MSFFKYYHRSFRLLFVALLLVALLPNLITIYSSIASRSSIGDFPNYYFSGRNILNSESAYQSISPTVKEELGVDYPAYPADPPLTILLLSPLSLMNYDSAALFFFYLSLFLVFSGTYITSRSVRISRLNSVALSVATLLTHSNLYLLKQNHMESILFFILSLATFRVAKQDPLSARIFIGIVSALKLFPALLLFSRIRRSNLREVLFGLATFTILTIFSVILIGSDDIASFVLEIIPRSKLWVGSVGNYSLGSFLSVIDFGELYWICAPALLIAFTFLSLRKSSSLDENLLSALAFAMLLSPLAWLNYLILLIPPAILRVSHLAIKNPDRALRLAFAVLLINFWPTDFALANLTWMTTLYFFPTLLLLIIALEPLIPLGERERPAVETR